MADRISRRRGTCTGGRGSARGLRLRRAGVATIVWLASLSAALVSCGPSEADQLRAQMSELEVALEKANEQIRQAADEIETAQESIGQAYSMLADAVEAMTIPEEVPVP